METGLWKDQRRRFALGSQGGENAPPGSPPIPAIVGLKERFSFLETLDLHPRGISRMSLMGAWPSCLSLETFVCARACVLSEHCLKNGP